eukprot:gnl/TRDRNA2_/TRDRNA2_153607_c0_seq1.p1 gnl/TRDRNA2_/TRDRNA2_153607_c0~~gnl/TRDRNA2_/TRDRNA2_153607_c0_seq1.p1  ORF type:complete len:603 (-),score=141.02 gnl/TRDRNA2_/TRDRNA2_153607_c0_seq1:79-1887(-)
MTLLREAMGPKPQSKTKKKTVKSTLVKPGPSSLKTQDKAYRGLDPEAILQHTGKRCNSEYLDERSRAADGLSVRECSSTTFVDKSGKRCTYSAIHIEYDIKGGRLELVSKASRPRTAAQRESISKKLADAKNAESQGQRRKAMDINRFYGVAQCSLKMEAKELMQKDFELTDPLAVKLWPDFERMAKRNLGQNEKWVPFHTVLGIHEKFLVEEVHHAKTGWNELQRFIAMFIFRSHCKCNLFKEVQLPHMKKAGFWKDPEAAFAPGSAMEKDALKFKKAGNPLQTSCFLIIPERILSDDDANLARNLVLRTQRLIGLAREVYPIVKDKKTSADQKFDMIAEKIQGVKLLGDTWVKMLMVVIDIGFPEIGLLRDRCTVGIGAADPLRTLLEDEGLLTPKEKKTMERREKTESCQTVLQLKAGIVAVKKDNKQVLQVTSGMAGSLDRAHAIAEALTELGNSPACQKLKTFENLQEKLHEKRQALFNDKSLKVPKLGLDQQRTEALEKKAADEAKPKEPGPDEALGKLRDRINASKEKSSEHFWKLIKAVEAHGRKYFEDLPLVVKQMQTKQHNMSAVTLQVQLCEYRQFEAFAQRSSLKRALDA